MRPSDTLRGNMSEASEAVRVEGAVAGYGAKTVLCGLSMRVRKGSIYALLGPSGCGKTTLLSCILGRKVLEAGQISVFNGVPGDRTIGLPGSLVGYMPQDICLYMEFTIQETFQYFGRLQRLSMDSLEKRQTELLELLELPEASRRVSALSGGQKRRLSFAVALLHRYVQCVQCVQCVQYSGSAPQSEDSHPGRADSGGGPCGEGPHLVPPPVPHTQRGDHHHHHPLHRGGQGRPHGRHHEERQAPRTGTAGDVDGETPGTDTGESLPTALHRN